MRLVLAPTLLLGALLATPGRATAAQIPPTQTAPTAARIHELAERCGSEIDWCTTWAEAAKRAREQGRPILALVRKYGGLKVLDTTMLAPFMDEAIVLLVRARFVALRFEIGDAAPFNAPERYGIGPAAFGTTLLVINADGDVLGDTFTVEASSLHDFLRETLPEADRPAPLARGEELLAQLEQPVPRAEVLARLGRGEEALALLAPIAANDPAFPAALFTRGVVEARSDLSAGQATWDRLLREHPESRHAWLAAALTELGWLQLQSGGFEPWPTAQELIAARRRPRAPLAIERAADAECDAVRFLLDAQLADGSWLFAGEVATEIPGRDLALTRAITAICATALLPAAREADADPRIEPSIARTLRFLHEIACKPTVYSGLAYDVWSEPALLRFVAAAIDAGFAEPDEWHDALAGVTKSLLAKQKRGGGFSYYGGADLANPDPALEISFSFVTAWALLALRDAQAMGVDVPEEAITRAVDCLARCRNVDETFEYSLDHAAEQAGRRSQRSGAAGRGPVCTLALLRNGRADAAKLEASVDRFLDHRALYAREQGKTLMHCGPEAEGSHYLLFDYAFAALAAAELPAAVRDRVRAPLLELVLAARTDAGSFVDNPLLGDHVGTALALEALRALRSEPKR